MTEPKPNFAEFIGVDVAKEELVVAWHGERVIPRKSTDYSSLPLALSLSKG